MEIKQYTTLKDHIELAEKIFRRFESGEISKSTVIMAHSRNRLTFGLSEDEKLRYFDNDTVKKLEKSLANRPNQRRAA